MKMKRFTALILAIVMTIGMFPVYTSADEGASIATTVPNETVSVTAAGGAEEENIPAVTQNAVSATEPVKPDVPAPADVTVKAASVSAKASASSYQANVGKRAKFDLTYSNFPVVSSPESVTADKVFNTDILIGNEAIPVDLIVKIVACYVNEAEGIYWYQIEAAEGYSLPEVFTEKTWVFQNYVDATGGESLIILADPVCEICGKTNCTIQHVQCAICGKYDCTALHFYCEFCDRYDCGKAHLYCNLCEKYDCTADHIWCGTCGAYDCGEVHEDPYTPVTEPVLPENPAVPEGKTVSVLDDRGNPVTELRLNQGEKISLSAWSRMDGASYRWQVRYDSRQDLWTDIQGQKHQGILVSPAMFLNVLDEQGSAAIRCVMTSGEDVRIGDAISVVMPQSAAASRYAAASVLPAADVMNPDELKKNYVVVQYEYSDGRTAAASAVAELTPGQAYSYTYSLPEIVGYKAVLKNESLYDGHVTKVGDELRVNYAAGELTNESTVITVVYEPDYVNYTVIHYWQNVDNDYYTEHERETVGDRYKTGEEIIDVHKSYPGFYNLRYETSAAAADGKTVIEVYYDRYYYLMTFELGEMGYGVYPVYARYEDTLEIGTPTRPGYTFLGWQLNGADATVPDKMPPENRKYVAKWQMANTAKVSVVFWGENPNDEGYSYLATGVVNVTPGTQYSYTNGNTVFLICGKDAHTHSSQCGITCGKTEHTQHTEACLGCEHVCDLDCFRVGNRYRLVRTDKPSQLNTPTRDGVYTYRSNSYTRYYLYLNGTWYCAYYYGYEKSDTQAIENDCDHTHSVDCYICEIHEHSNGCYSCGLEEHTHNNSCNQTGSGLDSKLWKFVSSETVTVAADGSSVINVKYDREEMTLTFHYGYTHNRYSKTSTITDKWGADIGERFLEVNTAASGNLWSISTNGDSPWTSYLQIMPQYDEDYYCRNTSTNQQTAEYYTENADGTYSLEYSVTAYYSRNLTISKEDFYEMEGFTYSHGTDGGGKSMPSPGSYGNFKGAKLYYKRHKYAIEFYNPTTLLKKTTGIYFESSMAQYEYTPTSDQAPVIYEPGSVAFAGWYQNPSCTGTRYDFSAAESKMPAGEKDGDTTLTFYAKWEPVEYKVNYFLTRDSMTRGENIPAEMARRVREALEEGKITAAPEDIYATAFAEDTVKHGAYIMGLSDPRVFPGYENIHPQVGYEFIGWFYLDDAGDETAFDPENIPVRQNLNLYAKWNANVLCDYNVYFALDENGDGVADTDENGIKYVAEPISGSAIAGRTRTFAAKGGNDLYTEYREGYFPTLGSHSITIDIKDEDGTGANSYIFLYKKKDAVPYTVKYVDQDGNVLAKDKYVEDNRNVVVTENFFYIAGYMPDAYQKTLVVTDDGDPDNDVIVFKYTKDTEHALYVTNYYIQDLEWDAEKKAWVHVGWSKHTDLQNPPGDIGTAYSANAITIDGYTLSKEYTDRYNVTEHINGMSGATLPVNKVENDVPIWDISPLTTEGENASIRGTLGNQGMELNFYYTRNLYPYEFRYVIKDTTTHLAPAVTGTAGFDTTVTGTAQETIGLDLNDDGKVDEVYRLDDPAVNTKEIRIKKEESGTATVNIATFNYVRCTQTVSITKRVAGGGADESQEFQFSLQINAPSSYHKTSYTFNKVCGTDTSTGPLGPEVPDPNVLKFTLKKDETITIEGLPVAEYTLTEQNLPTGYEHTSGANQQYTLTMDEALNVEVTNTYRAPLTELTITKTGASAQDAGQSFIFRVRSTTLENENANPVDLRVVITGNGSVTISELPIGKYTVTEDTDWSWRYAFDGAEFESASKANGAEITLDGDSNRLDVTNERTKGRWLSGADAEKNIFNGKMKSN